MKVVDLFCGIGGWTEGARAAGHEPWLAVDCDAAALKAHGENHPGCQQLCRCLPDDDLPWPAEDEAWHLHASPPCQKLSQCNRRGSSRREREAACALIEWVLDTVARRRPTTWSFEQVASRHVVDILRRRQAEQPSLFAFAVVNCGDYGVPQDRRRLLAGSPRSLSAFLLQTVHPRQTVRQALACPTEWIMNHTSNTPDRQRGGWRPLRPEEHMRHVDRPAYTVTTRALMWVDGDGTLLRRLTPREAALLQTFPPSYHLGRAVTEQRVHVGNAVPVEVARRFMLPAA